MSGECSRRLSAGRGTVGSLLTLIALTVVSADGSAAEPEVRTVDVRGLQVGGTTAVKFDGDGFGKAPRLLFPFPIKQQLRPGSTDKSAVVEVTLSADTPQGLTTARLVGESGMSAPLVFAIDRLPHRPVPSTAVPPGTAATVVDVPISLSGTVSGSSETTVRFRGKAGSKLTLEVEARRIGSKLRPVLHLYDAKRKQLTWAWEQPRLQGDLRIPVTLPADGEYTVAIHDAEYAAPNPSYFRLSIADLTQVEQLFPPIVSAADRSIEVMDRTGPRTIPITIKPADRFVTIPMDSFPIWTGSRPFVTVSNIAEHRESTTTTNTTTTTPTTTTTKAPQPIPSLPAAVSGRLAKPFEEDRYSVPVQPGKKYRIQVQAERWGSSVDPTLVIRDDKADLQRVEDSPGSWDPSVEYTVPAGKSELILAVKDGQGRGGPAGIYRLVVEPIGDAKDSDFSLTTPQGRSTVYPGRTVVVPVHVQRRNFTGRITINPVGLSSDMSVANNVIPEHASGTLVVITGGKSETEAALVRWIGTAVDGRTRPVNLVNHPLEDSQPWMAADHAVASTKLPVDFRVDWKPDVDKVRLMPGTKFNFPVTVTRPDPNTVVRLTLVSSQLPPVNAQGQPDPNRAVRIERATEVGPKASEAAMPIVVPADLSAVDYDFAVQAELLPADRRTVLATAVTPVRQWKTVLPVAIKLTGGPRYDAVPTGKTPLVLEISGEVVRAEGITGDCTVSLTGLPGNAKADAAVKAGTQAFTLKVPLNNIPPGDLAGLRVAASVPVDPKTPTVLVRGQVYDVVITVHPPKK